jgi:hypothetical protein
MHSFNPRLLARLSVAALLLGLSVAGAHSQADAQAQIQSLKAACGADAARLCGNVLPGGGRILACLQQQQSQLGADCRATLPLAGKIKDEAQAKGQLPK